MLKTNPETPSDAFDDVPPEGPIRVVGLGVAPGSGLKWGVQSSQFDRRGCHRGRWKLRQRRSAVYWYSWSSPRRYEGRGIDGWWRRAGVQCLLKLSFDFYRGHALDRQGVDTS